MGRWPSSSSSHCGICPLALTHAVLPCGRVFEELTFPRCALVMPPLSLHTPWLIVFPNDYFYAFSLAWCVEDAPENVPNLSMSLREDVKLISSPLRLLKFQRRVARQREGQCLLCQPRAGSSRSASCAPTSMGALAGGTCQISPVPS